MIDSVKDCAVSSLLGVDNKIVYVIPPYQREYTWQKQHWEDLFDDVLEAPAGYFLGSIICINQQKDATDVAALELIDGQQRMRTLSILLAALYASLETYADELDDEDHAAKINLKRKLVLKDPKDHVRLSPQLQNSNHDDFKAVLVEAGVLKASGKRPANAGNRRIMRAFRYFRERVAAHAAESDEPMRAVFNLIERVSAAVLVKIEVKSHSDAYVLFESLNNRGAQLTPIDLIKNKLLATTHGKDVDAVNDVFESWRSVIELLGDDYTMQERFFRQYYNAFKEELTSIVAETVATKSNLIRIYERLIEADHSVFVDKITAAAEIYSQIAGGAQAAEDPRLAAALVRLRRAQGAPSYLLMLYLMMRAHQLDLSALDLARMADLLVAFFVRRNVTGLPATYELQRFFMTMTAELERGLAESPAGSIVEMLRSRLGAISSSDEVFRGRLGGNMYEDSYDMTRFILSDLAESAMTAETRVDLWDMQDKKMLWSVEHIFPQGARIPAPWVEAMGGEEESAKAIQAELVHTLGNLSITRFNATLSNKSFSEKLAAVDSSGRSVGLRNGLSINHDVVAQDSWTRECIVQRGERLVEEAMAHYSMN